MNLVQKATLQIIIAAGIITQTQLRTHYDELCVDLNDPEGLAVALTDVFRTINRNLKPFSFGIKTVSIRDEDGERSFYHCCVNTADDDIAKKHGGRLLDRELVFFRQLLSQLALDGRMTSSDVLRHANEHRAENEARHKEAELTRLCTVLQQQGWLARDDRNFWVVGPRSYLELRDYIESCLREGLPEAELAPALAQLPQILFY